MQICQTCPPCISGTSMQTMAPSNQYPRHFLPNSDQQVPPCEFPKETEGCCLKLPNQAAEKGEPLPPQMINETHSHPYLQSFYLPHKLFYHPFSNFPSHSHMQLYTMWPLWDVGFFSSIFWHVIILPKKKKKNQSCADQCAISHLHFRHISGPCF